MSKELSPKEISAKTGLDENFIKKCIKTNFLQPVHFTATDGNPQNPYTGKRIERLGRAKGSRLVDSEVERLKERAKEEGRKLTPREIERAKVEAVQRARLEGTPINIEYEHVSAEEVFDKFWKSPTGKKRMTDPRFYREVMNVAQGNPVWWIPQGAQIGYSERYAEGYDRIFGKQEEGERKKRRLLTKNGDKKNE